MCNLADESFGTYPALQGYPQASQRQPSASLQAAQHTQQQQQQLPEQAQQQQHLQQEAQQQQQYLLGQPQLQQPGLAAQQGGDMQSAALYAQQLQYQQQNPQQQFMTGLMHPSGAVVKPEQQAQYGYMPQQQQAALELLPHQMHPYHALHGQQMVQVGLMRHWRPKAPQSLYGV